MKLFSLLILGAASQLAAAAPVAYTFSTGSSPYGFTFAIPELTGSHVTGTFTYDSSTPVTFTTTAAQNPANASIYGPFLSPSGPYSSYTGITATVSGGALGATSFTFSDPRGQTIVSNDGLVSPPSTPPSDILSIDLEPFGTAGTHNLAMPFTVDGFKLWNMRLFWLESTVGYDFLSDQSLPATLPTGKARLALDFQKAGVTPTGSPTTFVFYEDVYVRQVAAIPEPETYAMLLAGLGLLGFCARRRARSTPQA